MKILKIVLLVLVIGVAGVLALAATKPDAYHVERSAVIHAAPSVVFAQVDDFRSWEAWSPWEKLDPAMKRTLAGPERGKDATYSWAGNDKVGEGRMTITESEPDTHVGIRLEFLKPFTETCDVGFALASEGENTKVTWSMDGKHNYMSKVMCVFMDMDQMIGKDYEKGLDQLKNVAEAAPPVEAVPAAAAATSGK
jgi:hypothetical protein